MKTITLALEGQARLTHTHEGKLEQLLPLLVKYTRWKIFRRCATLMRRHDPDVSLMLVPGFLMITFRQGSHQLQTAPDMLLYLRQRQMAAQEFPSEDGGHCVSTVLGGAVSPALVRDMAVNFLNLGGCDLVLYLGKY